MKLILNVLDAVSEPFTLIYEISDTDEKDLDPHLQAVFNLMKEQILAVTDADKTNNSNSQD